VNTRKKINEFPDLTRISLFLLLLAVFYLVYAAFFKSVDTSAVNYNNNNTRVFGLNIPSNLTFCNELIPADDFEVRTKLEKEFFTNHYWKKNSRIIFNRVSRWFPYIEPILKEEGVPDDFKYVAVIESHLSNITSPAGAAGFWQLVKGTAINYGLIVNEEVDQRLDVEMSTRAACKLIKEAYKRFNNWTLAAAAYNVGISRLEKSLQNQSADNYHDLMLNKETGEFIYRILAYKTLLSDPQHFGLKPGQYKLAAKIPVRIIKVDSSLTSLTYLAKKLKCGKAHIKLFNPWLKTESLYNPNSETFVFKLPKDLKRDYSAYFMDLLGENRTDLQIHSTSVAVEDSVSVSHNEQFIHYTVKLHEMLEQVALHFHVTEKQILEWNKLTASSQVTPGISLRILPRKDEKGKK
jgi:membrane-bound lytic murein transglycosylase D